MVRPLSQGSKDIINWNLQKVRNDPSIHPTVGGGDHGRAAHLLLTLRRTLTTKDLAKYSPELLAVYNNKKDRFHDRCTSAYNHLRKKAIEEDDAFDAPEKFPGPSTLEFTSNTTSNNTTSNNTATTTHTSNHRAPQAPGLPPTETLYVTNNNNNVEPWDDEEQNNNPRDNEDGEEDNNGEGDDEEQNNNPRDVLQDNEDEEKDNVEWWDDEEQNNNLEKDNGEWLSWDDEGGTNYDPEDDNAVGHHQPSMGDKKMVVKFLGVLGFLGAFGLLCGHVLGVDTAVWPWMKTSNHPSARVGPCTVFLDNNGNGVQDPEEQRVFESVPVQLLCFHEDKFELMAFTTTDSDGVFVMNDLKPRLCHIQVAPPVDDANEAFNFSPIGKSPCVMCLIPL